MTRDADVSAVDVALDTAIPINGLADTGDSAVLSDAMEKEAASLSGVAVTSGEVALDAAFLQIITDKQMLVTMKCCLI